MKYARYLVRFRAVYEFRFQPFGMRKFDFKFRKLKTKFNSAFLEPRRNIATHLAKLTRATTTKADDDTDTGPSTFLRRMGLVERLA